MYYIKCRTTLIRMIADSSMVQHLEEETTNWRNVRATSIFTFVDSLQFSFYMWSFWPYLQKLDPSIGTTFVGLVLAVSGVGEALFAFIFGAWCDRIGRILPPVYLSIIMSLIGNIVYVLLGVFPLSWIPCALLISRFLSGAGSGNRGCFRALVAANSLGPDRAKALASSGGAALVGLTIGPAAQVCFNWIEDGCQIGPLSLNKYTVPAVLAIVINISTYIYVYFVLDDSLTPKRKVMTKSVSTQPISLPEDAEQTLPPSPMSPPQEFLRMDVLAAVICMGSRAIRMLVTANVESIGAPYTEIMFGFTHDEALQWNSLAQGVVGVFTILTFIVYAFTDYTKKVSERTNCFGAIIALLLFYLLTFPWPFLSGSVNCEEFVGNGTQNWNWCETLTPVNQWVYYASYGIFYGIALSVLNNSLQALYSRVLGSAPQGRMQGVSQAVGCISRILGPIVMSSTFSAWGPRATWGIIALLLLLTIFIWILSYRRLVPLDCRRKNRQSIHSTSSFSSIESEKKPSITKSGYSKF